MHILTALSFLSQFKQRHPPEFGYTFRYICFYRTFNSYLSTT